MKRFALLIAALACGFILSEYVVFDLIGYPRYVTGRKDYVIHESLGPFNRIILWPPYYSFWSVEGGNNIIRRNNIGLPGPNVDVSIGGNYILLLGNSFIEAGQYNGDTIAAGRLQNGLKASGSNQQVINLGASAHDPYVLWYRLLFFEDIYPPDRVVVVYESFNRLKLYYSRWALKTIYARDIFPREVPYSKITHYQRMIRSGFAYANLIVAHIKKTKRMLVILGVPMDQVKCFLMSKPISIFVNLYCNTSPNTVIVLCLFR